MEIVILGSGTGVPSLRRGAPGLLVKAGHDYLLFDTGPGTIKKLLEIGLTYHDITRIFYTHFHTDHTLDLAAILFAAKYGLSLRKQELQVIGPQGLGHFYKGLLGLYGQVIIPEAYQLKLQEIGPGDELNFDAYNILTRKMQHCPESLAYRLEANGKSMVYSGDTADCEEIVELGQNADILILECSFPNRIKVAGHLIPEQAATIARKCNCKKLVLTHLYPVCEQAQILEQAKKEFSGEIVVASDLMSIKLI
ncbi:MBL fold metallo-hydrolase [Candidatus Omnitrophota bacterium]